MYWINRTPVRKDGHHPIVLMQCGPIRFKENPKKATIAQPFDTWYSQEKPLRNSDEFSIR